MPSLIAQQVTTPFIVSPNTLVSIDSGTALIEYTSGTIADINNGAAVWKTAIDRPVFFRDTFFVRITAGSAVNYTVNPTKDQSVIDRYNPDIGFAGTIVTSNTDASGALQLVAGSNTFRTRALANLIPIYAMPNARAARLLQQQRKAPMRVVFGFDSTSDGYGAGTGTAELVDAYRSNVGAQTAGILKQLGINANNNNVCGVGNITTNVASVYNTYDPRVTFGTGWLPQGDLASLGGGHFQAVGITSGTLDFQFPYDFDKFTIIYPRVGGSNNISVAVDGANVGSYDCSPTAADGISKFSAPTVGKHKISLTNNVAATAWATVVLPWIANDPEIQIITCGSSGASITNIMNSGSNYFTYNALEVLAPHLTIVNCTLNDTNGSTAIATYLANHLTFLQRLIAIGSDVVVLYNSPINHANFTNGYADQLGAGIKAQCDSLSINSYDLRTILGSTWAAATANGYTDTATINHLSALGYSKIAEAVASLIAFN